jgi:tetratricopeptide (TPR) repeat protein
MFTSTRTLSIKAIALVALAATVLVGCQQEIISSNPRKRSDGMKAFGEGNYADAAGSFRAAIRTDPRDYKSQFYLGQCYEQLNQNQQAIQAYKASMDAQPRTLAGQEDEQQRIQTMDALASVIARADVNDAETNIIEQRARESRKPREYVLLAKIHENRGDADSAIDTYNQAYLIDAKDFLVVKEYGLYLEKVGQKKKAEQTLRKAYTIKNNDVEVNEALRRLNVIPGPGLKDENALVKPPVPLGPLPEVEWQNSVKGQTAQPAAARQPSDVPPPPTATPAPSQQRAVSAPRD